VNEYEASYNSGEGMTQGTYWEKQLAQGWTATDNGYDSGLNSGPDKEHTVICYCLSKNSDASYQHLTSEPSFSKCVNDLNGNNAESWNHYWGLLLPNQTRTGGTEGGATEGGATAGAGAAGTGTGAGVGTEGGTITGVVLSTNHKADGDKQGTDNRDKWVTTRDIKEKAGGTQGKPETVADGADAGKEAIPDSQSSLNTLNKREKTHQFNNNVGIVILWVGVSIMSLVILVFFGYKFWIYVYWQIRMREYESIAAPKKNPTDFRWFPSV